MKCGGLHPQSKADHLFISLHLAGWFAVRDRHGPAGGGMKAETGCCMVLGDRMYVPVTYVEWLSGDKWTGIV